MKKLVAATAAVIVLAGCGNSAPAGHGMGHQSPAADFRLALSQKTVGAGPFTFQILGAGGKPVTDFDVDQTKRMHVYLVRSDLTGFQHVHPEMATDGTWSAAFAAPRPGSYRVYASFSSMTKASVLSEPVSVAGQPKTEPLPAPAATTTVDGYTLTVDGAALTAGKEQPLSISVAKDGRPVTDLQPYLETYAHLTAFHAGDLAFAHLHPQGMATSGNGGPKLSFHASLPKAGDWRLYVQFQTAGTLHTAAITLRVK